MRRFRWFLVVGIVGIWCLSSPCLLPASQSSMQGLDLSAVDTGSLLSLQVDAGSSLDGIVGIRASKVPAGLTGSKKEGKTVSLDESIEIALKNNRQLLLVEEGENQASARVSEAESRQYPSVSANVSYRRVDEVQSFTMPVPGLKPIEMGSLDNYSAELSIRQTLYAGGRIRAGIRSARIGQSIQSAQKDDFLRTLIFQIKKAYYDVLLNEEILRVNLKSEEVISAHFETVQKQYKEGMVSNYDVLRSGVQLSNIRALRIQSQSTLQRSKLYLVNLIGLPLEESEGLVLSDKLSYEALSPLYQEMERLAFSNRADLRATQMKIELQNELLNLAKAENYPTFSLIYNYGDEKPSRKVMGMSEWGTYWNIMALISIPVSEGGRVSARIRQETSAFVQSELMLTDLKEKIRLELTQSLLGLKDALALINSQKDNVKQAGEGLRLAEIGYKNGVNTQLEVMDAQMALDTASKNYIQAVYQYALAKASVDWVINKPR
ncbi:MAG: TolC family protein [Planctomycetota bacterium]|nr:TolC family protein [Planctomycetota bacterium]MDI6788031.1 TolC family protein [Planctomycetota bacterium]